MRFFTLLVAVVCASAQTLTSENPLAWPPLTRESRPAAYWWWMGSAVNPRDLTRELERYHAAGLGGVHIIPIHGAKGYEQQSIPYLSPSWMEMLRHTLQEAERLDLNVDMTLGTGWCFGGPSVTERETCALAVLKTFTVSDGTALNEKFPATSLQALVAFSATGQVIDLRGQVGPDGALTWSPTCGTWRVCSLTQRPSGRMVKRAAPGGAGPMLNPLFGEAIRHYLEAFTTAFAGFSGPKLRAIYHDSFEYHTDWSPDLLAEFERRRGYRLQTQLLALSGAAPEETVARVKCDYRETISDMMIENFMPPWVNWAHARGLRARNQAHGSPGNLLDLYAAVDIPETEMFNKDRSVLASKFASSAAHVQGRPLVAAETGTWLKEHFTETLGDMKNLVDLLFLAGVNHVVYHGTCYSPDAAPWPGWLFYASTQMNPRNPIWRDSPALHAYIARCQSILQSGRSDNDILLYWPVHDLWHDPAGMAKGMTVHSRFWIDGTAAGALGQQLWDRGFAFDFVSDRQLAQARTTEGRIAMPGGEYRAVLVPRCRYMPNPTLEKLLALARVGGTVIFTESLPQDVPGLADLDGTRARRKQLLEEVKLAKMAEGSLQLARLAHGQVLIGDTEAALAKAGIAREAMTDQAGLTFVRRAHRSGHHYLIVHRGQEPFDGRIILAKEATSIVLMDPMSGRTGLADRRLSDKDCPEVRLQLMPGESLILRTFSDRNMSGSDWRYRREIGPAVALTGTWQVVFTEGGPELPAPVQTATLASWTELGGDPLQRFAGSAQYSITFDEPAPAAGHWFLDLGRVCQSARVRLNGQNLGTLFASPFRVPLPQLKRTANLLEVEVTSVAANRIRDLDRRKVPWRTFHDINLVNLDYKPFDASSWPLTESGLLGPVTLIPGR